MSEHHATVEPQEELQETLNDGGQNAEIESNDTDVSTDDNIDEGDTEENQELEDKKQVQTVTPKKTFDDRKKEIAKEVWKKHEAARALKAENDRQEQILRQMQASQPDVQKPKIENYDSEEDFQVDTEKYFESVAEKKVQQNVQAEIQRRSHQQRLQQNLAKWEVARDTEAETNPAFPAAVGKVAQTLQAFSPTDQQAELIAATITSDEQSVQIFNYLARNPDEAQKIAQLPPQSAIMELGAVKAKFTQKPKQKFTKAPAPVSPERGGGGAPKDLARMSQSEYDRYMNEKQYGKR